MEGIGTQFRLQLVANLGKLESEQETERACTKCGLVKPLTDFHRCVKDIRYGVQSKCKVCKNEENTKWRRANPEKMAANKRRYRDKNGERLRVQQRAAYHALNAADPTAAKLVRRKQHMAARYGLTVEAFERLLEEFDGKCGICRRTSQRLVVDHDHETGAVRGILCVKCNVSLGAFGDSIRGLKTAIAYLKNASKHGDRRGNDSPRDRGGSVERCRQRTLGFTLADWAEAGS